MAQLFYQGKRIDFVLLLYLTAAPLKVVGELTDAIRMPEAELQRFREQLGKNKGEMLIERGTTTALKTLMPERYVPGHQCF